MRLQDFVNFVAPTPLKKRWRAVLAGWEGTGSTKEHALMDAREVSERASRYQGTMRYRRALDGTVFVLYYAFDTWQYDMFHMSGNCSTAMLSARTIDEALAVMDSHVRQLDEDTQRAAMEPEYTPPV